MVLAPYVGVVTATAYGASALRRWAIVGALAWAGAMLWSLALQDRASLISLAFALGVSGLAASLIAKESRTRLVGSLASLGVTAILLHCRFEPSVSAALWAPSAIGSALLAIGAVLLARRSNDRRGLVPALWIWSAVLSGFLAIHDAGDPRTFPALFSAAALGLALLHAQWRQRGLAETSLAAAGLGFASLLGPAVAGAALAGKLPPITLMETTTAAIVLLATAAFVARRRKVEPWFGDSLATAALICGLTGLFLLLRLIAVGAVAPGVALDALTEASFRSLALLVAGLLASARSSEQESAIARYRGPILLGAGLLHAFCVQVLALNPLWGVAKVFGPPFIDSLAIAYLAPALLALAAARRNSVSRQGWLGFCAASAFSFGLVWLFLETRRLFHGPQLYSGPDLLGRCEAAVYALLVLTVAWALFQVTNRLAQRSQALSPIAHGVGLVAKVAAWTGVVVAIWVFGYYASPWWGPIGRPMEGGSAAFLLALYAGGAIALYALHRASQARGFARLATALKAGIVFQGFLLITLGLRWAFRGADMHTALASERMATWAFSAMWALYGLGVLMLGVVRRDVILRWAGLIVLLGTAVKVLLFDMARLDGVIRAASFLVVGGLLLVAALASRRLSGGWGAAREAKVEPASESA